MAINIQSDRKYNILSPWGMSLIPYKGRILFCAEQYTRLHMSKSKEFRESIINAVSIKQLLYLTKSNVMQQSGIKIDPEFEKNHFKLMRRAYKLKIENNPLIAELLKSTGKEKLIYDNQWDEYFGTGKQGKGQNKLNKILVKLRASL